MPSAYFNLNSAAWRRIGRNGETPFRLELLGQRLIAAPYFSFLGKLQEAVAGKNAPLRDDPIFILGYWRSGTTLLHEYMVLDTNLRAPSTHACMNPHHFVFTQRGIKPTFAQRPMDKLMVQPSSPGEDDFAFLGLGAPSPYEAFLFPDRLNCVMRPTANSPASPSEHAAWLDIIRHFYQAVQFVEGPHQLVLKSPPHAFRLPALANIFPNARYIVMVRDPVTQFESAVRMWHSMAQRYAFTAVPPKNHLREIVLAHRLYFEEKLWQSLSTMPAHRHVVVRFESLVQSPLTTLEHIYETLSLDGFEAATNRFADKAGEIKDYLPASKLPSSVWLERVTEEWGPLITRYGYA